MPRKNKRKRIKRYDEFRRAKLVDEDRIYPGRLVATEDWVTQKLKKAGATRTTG